MIQESLLKWKVSQRKSIEESLFIKKDQKWMSHTTD
jgi:hypothetical protein